MKSGPWGVAIAVAAFVVPILVAMVMLGFYTSNRIVIKVTRQEIVNYETNIKTLSDAVKLQGSLEKEKNDTSSCLSEVLSSVGRHTQWSPVLVTMVENMPDSMVLTRLEVKQNSVNKQVPKRENPKEMMTVSVPASTLRMSVSGRSQADSDKAVKDFKDRLRLSALLAPKIEDIVISQKTDTFEGKDVVSYDIDCIFKPEL